MACQSVYCLIYPNTAYLTPQLWNVEGLCSKITPYQKMCSKCSLYRQLYSKCVSLGFHTHTVFHTLYGAKCLRTEFICSPYPYMFTLKGFLWFWNKKGLLMWECRNAMNSYKAILLEHLRDTTILVTSFVWLWFFNFLGNCSGEHH